ncbi:SiaB family protein kinase [Flavobacteriales bacterium]|nr:SiaB family protein kinase [Flavobacteriales bacterium]MDC3338055.1 SiaB family protein kinase [Flavobacteriales bacterium]
MGKESNNVLEVCNSRYQEIYGNYNISLKKKIVVSHFGEFSQDLVNSISNGVEEAMIVAEDKKGTVKRMFSILVEGLQNIRLHGEKDEDGNQASFLIIAQDEDAYLVTLANLVLITNKPVIEERLAEINSFDEKQVKSLYMEVLTNGIISNKGGAGLGFITMAMKSKNKLNFSIEPINDNLACFCIELKINRKKS